ncbi:hypothetical protein V1514DRAFT_370194 [Lipomyces japonicus]|uniref:uncharacterized protein n=1 Tax=Lipomyces japonicus TaxID=56871 RepID=UPI0034CD62E3
MTLVPDKLRVFNGSQFILPQINQNNSSHLILVTESKATSASWLLQHYIKAGLSSSPHVSDSNDHRKIVLVSFLQDQHFHFNCLRKYGIDLTAKKSSFSFVDGISNFFSDGDNKANGLTTLYLRASRSSSWSEQLTNVLRDLSTDESKPLLIIEGIDVLIPLQVLSASDILNFIFDLYKSSSTIVVSMRHSPDLQNTFTQIGAQHGNLLSSLQRQSHAVISLRPLITGAAEDVTGLIRIVRGGAAVQTPQFDVTVDEFHYFVGEGNLSGVKIFEKGRGH